jgi:hypothetical protein
VCFSRRGSRAKRERTEERRERLFLCGALFSYFRLREESSERDFFFATSSLPRAGHQRPQTREEEEEERESFYYAHLVKNERALRFRGVLDLRLDD